MGHTRFWGIALATLYITVVVSAADTWCGKNYKSTDPIVPPGGNFVYPSKSDVPLLALRCTPALTPYLDTDEKHEAKVLIDTKIVHTQIANAQPINLDTTSSSLKQESAKSVRLVVSVFTDDGLELASGAVGLNTSAEVLPLDLSKIEARKEGYTLSCKATYSPSPDEEDVQTFKASSTLKYLPNPTDGSTVTKFDAYMGGLLARPVGTQEAPFEYVFPFGFYTQFDSYLAQDLSSVDEIKRLGFNMIHPTPTYTNETALVEVTDRMAEVGLYLMYDMRWTYQNTTSVTSQVSQFRTHPSLLLWYTADEPDGTSDPTDATLKAHDLIFDLDGGGYHPVSLVLNCQDYKFEEYSEGAEVVLQDAYMIGNNATYSTEWDTPCTPDYGDCGCDNCVGEFEDISRRMDEYRERLWILRRERESVVWTVPQAFGNSSYWKRRPTGKEWVVMALLGVNHGALGVVSWDFPTTPDITASASALALVIPSLVPYLFNHSVIISRIALDRVDGCVWTITTTDKGEGVSRLVILVNMNYEEKEVKWKEYNLDSELNLKVKTVYESGAKVKEGGVVLGPVATGIFVIQ